MTCGRGRPGRSSGPKPRTSATLGAGPPSNAKGTWSGLQKVNVVSHRSPWTLGFVAVLAVILAGCGSSAPTPALSSAAVPSGAPTVPVASGAAASDVPGSATPSGAPTASGAPTDSSSPGSSGEPSAAATIVEPSLSPSATPAVPVATDSSLESRLPDTFRNVKLAKESIAGPTLATGGNDQSTKDILSELQALGKTPNDLSFAVANDPAGKLPVLFGAYRIKGVDAATWLPQMIEIANKQSKSTPSQLDMGGKGVTKLVPANGHQPSYLWPSGDVVFIVITTDEAAAAEAMAALH